MGALMPAVPNMVCPHPRPRTQITGQPTVLYYASQIFRDAGWVGPPRPVLLSSLSPSLPPC